MSDIHSNLEALDAVRRAEDIHNMDRIFLLGDIVGYGANPNECIETVQDMGCCVVAGNHDYAAVDKTNINNFNPVAKQAILWTKERLKLKHKQFLSCLPLKKQTKDAVFVHATPSHPQHWDYILSLSDAIRTFRLFSHRVCFIAHSHTPEIFAEGTDGEISFINQSHLILKEGYRYIINIGSVGQPRDGNPMSSYGIYDTDTKHFSLVRVPYNISLAQQKILDAGLPEILAIRLSLGQ